MDIGDGILYKLYVTTFAHLKHYLYVLIHSNLKHDHKEVDRRSVNQRLWTFPSSHSQQFYVTTVINFLQEIYFFEL